MNASEGIQFIKAVKELGIKEEAAEKIVSLVESQKGELATKADIDQIRQEGRRDIERLEASIEQLKEGQKEQGEQSKKEIEQAEKRLEASIDQLRTSGRRDIERLEASIEQLREGQKEQRKGNRWAIGLLATAIIGGLTLLGIIITYQNSDMRTDIRQLLQIHLNEQQAERTGNSARTAQEGRVGAADSSGS